jgi:hypothetical protein
MCVILMFPKATEERSKPADPVLRDSVVAPRQQIFTAQTRKKAALELAARGMSLWLIAKIVEADLKTIANDLGAAVLKTVALKG